MGKKLAIKDHPTRGKEIITLLEMMGGYADELVDNGTDERYAYFILEEENNAIDRFPIDKKDEFEFDTQIFTLEEFLEKYPYKVGDTVHSPCKGCIKTITGMKWSSDRKTITYELDNKIYTNTDILNVCNNPKHDMETNALKIAGSIMKNNTHSIIYVSNCVDDEIELQLGDYEIEVRNGKTYAVKKKPVYPKNYEECCKIMYGISHKIHLQYDTRPSYKFEEDLRDLLENLRKLIICRNAYWKIVGEQMGLDKPWEPDWKDMYYAITVRDDGDFLLHRRTRALLIFPTEEMRDAFYENFKDLIEMCKELL